jgi:putative protease
MKKIVDAAKENGIHALIASDQSVLQYARSAGMEVHISTQLSVSNIESVKFYSAYADVVVLARELSLQQVSAITDVIKKENIKGPSGENIKIELFAHGALCMAISGKCYMSLHEYNFSANRGECLQICRRGYHVTDIETGASLDIENEYIMSPKDLCTINFLDKVLKAGVQVLKIEGRARSAEYVKTVCGCYDEAVRSVCDQTYSQEKINDWMKRLGSVFNRGFWDGYYLGRRLGEWSGTYGSKASKKKIYVGKVTNHFSKIRVAEILMETGDLKTGDEIIIIGPTTGVIETVIEEIRVDEKPVEKTNKGERCSIPIEEIVRRSDKVYKLVANED